MRGEDADRAGSVGDQCGVGRDPGGAGVGADDRDPREEGRVR